MIDALTSNSSNCNSTVTATSYRPIGKMSLDMLDIPPAPPSPQSCTAYSSHGGMSTGMPGIPHAPESNKGCILYHKGLVYTTEDARINFPHLTDDNKNGNGKYSVCLSIPKSAPGIQAFREAIIAAKSEGIKRYGCFNPTHGGLRDGDKERAGYIEFAGKYFVNASSRKKPQLIDTAHNPLTTRDEVNSNSVGVACLRFYPIKSRGNGEVEVEVEAIGCQIMGFMKVKDASDAATGRGNIDYFADYRR